MKNWPKPLKKTSRTYKKWLRKIFLTVAIEWIFVMEIHFFYSIFGPDDLISCHIEQKSRCPFNYYSSYHSMSREKRSAWSL